MSFSFRRRAASQLFVRSMSSQWGTFRGALRNPRALQERILFSNLQRNSATEFGRKFSFNSIQSLEDYQKFVPVSDYEFFRPWVERSAAGEKNLLTAEEPLLFEKTSGSTSLNKLIPFNKSFFREIRNAVNPWIYETYRAKPELHGTSMYWSISPVTQKKEYSASGLPIGVSDDSEYFNIFARLCLRELIILPKREAFSQDFDFWRKETCTSLMAAEDLGFISIWSPTFLMVLMEEIEANLTHYLEVLPRERRQKIDERRSRGTPLGEALWPHLQVLSCWTDAGSATFLPALLRWFSPSVIQSKGLLATEGVISIPFGVEEQDCPLAITSHFLEFIHEAHPEQRPLFVDELQPGEIYSPVITTGAGLYRYHLKDRIQCTGFLEKTPKIRFLGKLEQVSDLCGEKLSLLQVQEAIENLEREFSVRPKFKILFPVDQSSRFYQLVLSGEDIKATLDFDKAQIFLDEQLRRNIHFDYARKIGQLSTTKIYYHEQALSLYTSALLDRGMRLGDIKSSVFDHRTFWQTVFPI